MQKIIYAGATALATILIILYLWHIWSDCMDENSWLTCVRMLSR